MKIDVHSLNDACRQTIGITQQLDNCCVIMLNVQTGVFTTRRSTFNGRVSVPPHSVSLGIWLNAEPDDVLQFAQHVVCSVRAMWLG